jgi:hypothetical protein
LVSLPEHFNNLFLNLSGTHRKIVLKDQDLTIKGSFNYLSNNSTDAQKFAAEEATIFYDRTADRWREIFQEYTLAMPWLDFL